MFSFHISICGRGFTLRVWEYDFDTDGKIIFSFALIWKTERFRESWRWSSAAYGDPSLTWARFKNGQQVDGFRLQGPLVRFHPNV